MSVIFFLLHFILLWRQFISFLDEILLQYGPLYKVCSQIDERLSLANKMDGIGELKQHSNNQIIIIE